MPYALRLMVATDSVVEPALEPVLRAWGFSVGENLLPTSSGARRDSALVDSLLALVRWSASETWAFSRCCH